MQSRLPFAVWFGDELTRGTNRKSRSALVLAEWFAPEIARRLPAPLRHEPATDAAGRNNQSQCAQRPPNRQAPDPTQPRRPRFQEPTRDRSY